GDHDPFVAVLRAPHLPKRRDGLGQRELLAAERRDEAPAADLAARLPAPIDIEQYAPARRERLAAEDRAAHDAVAAEQRSSGVLERGGIDALGRDATRRGPERRPARFPVRRFELGRRP